MTTVKVNEPKKVLRKTTDRAYNARSRSTCRKKGGTPPVTGYKLINATLHDHHGTWVVRARVYDPETQKYKQKSKSTGFKVKDNTKRKALEKLREIQAIWETEANAEITPPTKPLSYYIEKYIDRKALEVREGTIISYQQYADTYILPAIGDIPINKIDRRTIQNFYDNLVEQGHSANSIRKYAVVLKGAFHCAILADAIDVNVASDVDLELPRHEKYNGSVYTLEQAKTFLEKAKNVGEPIYSVSILTLCYGLRRSEVCGLRWKDVNLERGEILICNTVTQNGNHIIETEQTKTKKSRRVLILHSQHIEYFKQLQKNQLEAGLELGKVCRYPDGREPTPDYVYKKVKKLQRKYGLPEIRLHDFRATAVSILASHSDLSPKQLQDFLGHEKVSTTLEIYAKAYDHDKIETARAMSELFETN